LLERGKLQSGRTTDGTQKSPALMAYLSLAFVRAGLIWNLTNTDPNF